MGEEDFFSPKHNRLMNIATWAKYLAWVVLVIFILLAITTFIGDVIYRMNFGSVGRPIKNFTDFFKQFPVAAFSLLFNAISTLLKGAIYFLVLKGISLGLNMIVETDINYREVKSQDVSNE